MDGCFATLADETFARTCWQRLLLGREGRSAPGIWAGPGMVMIMMIVMLVMVVIIMIMVILTVMTLQLLIPYENHSWEDCLFSCFLSEYHHQCQGEISALVAVARIWDELLNGRLFIYLVQQIIPVIALRWTCLAFVVLISGFSSLDGDSPFWKKYVL